MGVLRAHQHNDNPLAGPMMSAVRAGRGMHDNWGGAGLVVTWLSGAHIPGQRFVYDAYGLLHMEAGGPAAWRMALCSQPTGAPFTSSRKGGGSGSSKAGGKKRAEWLGGRQPPDWMGVGALEGSSTRDGSSSRSSSSSSVFAAPPGPLPTKLCDPDHSGLLQCADLPWRAGGRPDE